MAAARQPDEEDFTVWVVNNAEDPWMADNQWNGEAAAMRGADDSSYLDVMDKRQSQLSVTALPARHMLQYDSPQSAIATSVVEDLRVVMPKSGATLEFDDSTDFFSKK